MLRLIQTDGTEQWLLGNLKLTLKAGDPKIVFDIAGTPKFSIGVDDSDSDKLEICAGGVIGTNVGLVIDSNYNVTPKLIRNLVTVAGTKDFTAQACTYWTGTQITLTAVTPSVIHYAAAGQCYADVARAYSWMVAVFVDGVQADYGLTGCSPAIGRFVPFASAAYAPGPYAAGDHTVELRVYVYNAGDTVTGTYPVLSAWLSKY